MNTLEATLLDEKAKSWKRENRLFTSTMLVDDAPRQNPISTHALRSHRTVWFVLFSLLRLFFHFRNCHCWSLKPFTHQMRPQTMGLVRITTWYPNFNGSHFGLPPSEIHRMTRLPPKTVWTMTYSHRPHWTLRNNYQDGRFSTSLTGMKSCTVDRGCTPAPKDATKLAVFFRFFRVFPLTFQWKTACRGNLQVFKVCFV